jgi:hypothetical protein
MDNKNTLTYAASGVPLTAPPVKVPFYRDPKVIKISIISALIILVVTITAIIWGTQAGLPKVLAGTVSIRLSNLEELRANYGEELRSPQALRLNSELRIALRDASAGLNPFLPKIGVDVRFPDSAVVSSETSHLNDLKRIFDQALVNKSFDHAFAREFAIELDSAVKILEDLNLRVSEEGFNAYVLSTKTTLQALKIKLQDFAATE